MDKIAKRATGAKSATKYLAPKSKQQQSLFDASGARVHAGAGDEDGSSVAPFEMEDDEEMDWKTKLKAKAKELLIIFMPLIAPTVVVSVCYFFYNVVAAQADISEGEVRGDALVQTGVLYGLVLMCCSATLVLAFFWDARLLLADIYPPIDCDVRWAFFLLSWLVAAMAFMMPGAYVAVAPFGCAIMNKDAAPGDELARFILEGGQRGAMAWVGPGNTANALVFRPPLERSHESITLLLNVSEGTHVHADSLTRDWSANVTLGLSCPLELYAHELGVKDYADANDRLEHVYDAPLTDRGFLEVDFYAQWFGVVVPALEQLPPQTPYWTEQISQDVYLKVLASWMSDNATTLLEEHYNEMGIVVSNVAVNVNEILPP